MSELKFSALTSKGNEFTEKDLIGNKTILFFYPKDLTPGCTKEACGFRDVFNEITSIGYKIYGVSRCGIDSHKKFMAKYILPFELISDAEGHVCTAFGVWQEKSMFGKKYMGIVRSTFVIDEAGSILKEWPKVSVTNHAKEVLAWVQSSQCL